LGNCVSGWRVLIFQCHIPGDSILYGSYNIIFLYQEAVEEEGAGTCKLKVNSYQTIHHHITEDRIFYITK